MKRWFITTATSTLLIASTAAAETIEVEKDSSGPLDDGLTLPP